jgi:small-conductance mechanosensitive channel
MLLVILAIWLGYKKARDSGRNPYLWAFISAAVFIGTQVVVGLLIGGVIGFGIAFWGWRETAFNDSAIIITIISIVASIGSLILVLWYLDRLPDDGVTGEPPPPPTFSG